MAGVKTLTILVSANGFGHIRRQILIARELLRRFSDFRITFALTDKQYQRFKLEIEAIMKHERNDHVIIIDDVHREYIGESGIEWIKETLAKHNPLYTFTKTNVHPNTGGQFIAYIP